MTSLPPRADGASPTSARPVGAPSPLVLHDRVRWGDVDYARIVRYDAFARFYDLAESELFRAAGFPQREVMERHHLMLPRRVLHAEFHAPARLDDLLELHAYVSHVGTTSLTVNFDLYHAGGGTLCAASYLVLVCVVSETLAKRPLPTAMVEALARFRVSVEEARGMASRAGA